jgi:hypothetical protein
MKLGLNTEKAKAEMAGRKQLEKESIDKLFGAERVEAERLASGGTNYALYNYIMTVHSFSDCKSALDFGREMYRFIYPNLMKLQRAAQLMAGAFTDEQLAELGINKEELNLDEVATKALKKFQAEVKVRSKLANKHNVYLDKAKEMGVYNA